MFTQKHGIFKTMHEKVKTILHAPKASIDCVVSTNIENKNNAPFLHDLFVLYE